MVKTQYKLLFTKDIIFKITKQTAILQLIRDRA